MEIQYCDAQLNGRLCFRMTASIRAFLVATASIVLCALSACSKPVSPFEGTWNNSASGKEGIWIFITKKDDEGHFLLREAVARPDNIAVTSTAAVKDGNLMLDQEILVKEYTFLDATHNTLITVSSEIPEIKFFRQP